jgi:hypothetical protein
LVLARIGRELLSDLDRFGVITDSILISSSSSERIIISSEDLVISLTIGEQKKKINNTKLYWIISMK